MTRRDLLSALSAVGLFGCKFPQMKGLEGVRERGGLPSLASLVLLDSKIVDSQAVGYRKIGNPTEVTIHDKFHLGSCTKAMTATLCGMLVDQGKLTWETTIPDIFPRLQFDPAFKSITLDLLLSQTSGLSSESWPKTHSFVGWHEMKGTPRERRMAYLTDTVKVAPNKPVGSKFEYSNTNYALAGILAETVADLAYEKLIQREIFDKLGMESAGFGHPADPNKVDTPDQPWPHRMSLSRAKEVVPSSLSDNPDVITPAGRVHCNILDWSKYIAAELHHLRHEPGLLREPTSDHLHTPREHGDYMGGWIITSRPWAHGKAFTHTGSNTVNMCVAWIAPDRNFASLAMTNIGGDAVFPVLDSVIGDSIKKWL